MMKTILRPLGALAILAATAFHANAGPITTQPAGLAPGGQYRLIFYTADPYTSTSSDIATYNNAVTSEANAVGALASLGTDWRVIASTSSVSAIDNIGAYPGVPVFGLDGIQVANDATASFFGLFQNDHPIYVPTDENGNSPGATVWTGENWPLGDSSGLAGHGVNYAVGGGQWLYTGIEWQTDPESLYVISGVLTATGTPEPSTAGIALAGMAAIFLAQRRYRSARPAVTARD